MMLVVTHVQLGFTVWVMNNSCRGCFHVDSVAADAAFVSGRILSCRRCSVLSRREGKTVVIDQTVGLGPEVTGLGHWRR